ncbi:MAG: hypothetical protein AAFQ04_08920 [Pseudomonadota bacterium]
MSSSTLYLALQDICSQRSGATAQAVVEKRDDWQAFKLDYCILPMRMHRAGFAKPCRSTVIADQGSQLSNDVRIVDVTVEVADDFQRDIDNGITIQRFLGEMQGGIEHELLAANVAGTKPARALVELKAFSFSQSKLTTETSVFDATSGQQIGQSVLTTTKRPVGPSVFNTFNNHLPFRSYLLVSNYAGGKIASDLYGR